MEPTASDIFSLTETLVGIGLQENDFPQFELVLTTIGGASGSLTPDFALRTGEGDQGELP